MKTDRENEQVTRESVLKLLSDAEVAKVSTEETTPRLLDGDEYLDLNRLDRGVLRAHGPDAPMDSVLPRKAVHADTWSKLLTRLAAPVA